MPNLDCAHKRCADRGWTDPERATGPPTTNPHLLYSLCELQQSPFGDDSLLQPVSLSARLEAEYITLDRPVVSGFRARPTDVVVCGAMRSGQTPVLQALASLEAKRYVAKHELLDHTTWIEAKARDLAACGSPDRRLVKTHLPVRSVFGGSVPRDNGRAVKTKVVVCLRDPQDVRLSWFRHVRRVYGKFHQQQQRFDALSPSESWANLRLYCANPNFSVQFDQTLDYEDFCFDAVRALGVNSGQVMLCFYEDLLNNPLEFVARLAQFVGRERDAPLEHVIAQALYAEPEFPQGFFHCDQWSKREQGRVGSTSQACKVFSPLALRRNEEKWKYLCSLRGPDYKSYGDLRAACGGVVVAPNDSSDKGTRVLQRLSHRVSSTWLGQRGQKFPSDLPPIHRVLDRDQSDAGLFSN